MHIIIGIVITVIFIYTSSYNSLIRRKNAVKNAFGSVDAMLRKRFDLIPNLVKLVKHYMEHEKELIIQIEQLQLKYNYSSTSRDEKVEIDNQLQNKLSSLQKVISGNTELSSNQNMLHLQKSLVDAEEQISAARRFYNTAVTEYNNKVQSFPASIIASQLKLRPLKVFSIPKFDRITQNMEDLL